MPAISRVVALLAVAFFGIVMSQAFNLEFERRIERLNLSPALQQEVTTQRSKLAAIALPPQASIAERHALKETIGESFVYGFRSVMLLSAILALTSALSAWLMIDDRAGRDRARHGSGHDSRLGSKRVRDSVSRG